MVCIFIAVIYAIDSSATETEDETIRLGINPARDRQKKSKGKKKKEREKATKANAKKAKKLKKDKKLKDKATPLQKNRKVCFKKVGYESSNLLLLCNFFVICFRMLCL